MNVRWWNDTTILYVIILMLSISNVFCFVRTYVFVNIDILLLMWSVSSAFWVWRDLLRHTKQIEWLQSMFMKGFSLSQEEQNSVSISLWSSSSSFSSMDALRISVALFKSALIPSSSQSSWMRRNNALISLKLCLGEIQNSFCENNILQKKERDIDLT